MVMMRTGFFKMSSGTARLYQPVELKSYVEPWEGSGTVLCCGLT